MPDTATAPKRRRLPSGERRQEFIEKAIDFFAEEGFESSTRGLAKRLGVTQPLLYRYFPSKEDLISEVYDAVYVNRWRPEWADLLTDRDRPLRDRLIAFYNVYTDVIFNREWMRIYLFSGLKGVDINRRYMGLVRQRILTPIVNEARAEPGLFWVRPDGRLYLIDISNMPWSRPDIEFLLSKVGFATTNNYPARGTTAI